MNQRVVQPISCPRTVCQFGILLALALTCGGCGGNDVPRFDVKGTVTYDGKPLPSGRILFYPDAKAGNNGPAGQALIVDGSFDTADTGNPTVGGPHVIVISGYDGRGDADTPLGQPLFNRYQVKTDLPKESSEQSFDIPRAKTRNR
ncbi:MAG: hypothetical protein MI757_12575 [Pirellulales bacterium]|nr:hypothetical protein [Pirellulales bacterium]